VDGFVGDVDSDDGEITGFEFKDVRAVVQGDGLPAVGVRVLTDAAEEFNGGVHAPPILDHSKVTVKQKFCDDAVCRASNIMKPSVTTSSGFCVKSGSAANFQNMPWRNVREFHNPC